MSIPNLYYYLVPLISIGALTLSGGADETKAPPADVPKAEGPGSDQCLPPDDEPVSAPRPDSETSDDERPVIEVVFALDTTGSMGGLIAGAKAKIWSIASRIVQGRPSPDLRVGLVGYRDVDDAYVTRVVPLSGDLDAVHADLRSFTAGGGGDTPEHVALALEHAVERMQWSSSDDDLRIIYLVGDAPPQAYPGAKTAEHWSKVARKRGIIVNAIRCGDMAATEPSFRSLAQLGGGLYFSVAQDGGMARARTPFDDEIRRLELEAGRLAMVGGGHEARKASAAKRDRVATLSPEVGADRSAYHAASGKGAGRWVAEGAVDLAAEPESLDELDEEELPSELRTLSAAERRDRVRARAERRAEIDRNLEKLAERRRTYLEKQAKFPDGVDDLVLADVERRAARLGVSY